MNTDTKKAIPLGYLKGASQLVRDILITAIVAVCLVNPSSIKNFLLESGLSKLEVFGVTAELQQEKEKIVQAQEQITEQLVTSNIESPDDPPLEATNRAVDPEFMQIVLNAKREAPQILPTSGWVFLGHVNKEKSRWADKELSTTTATWPVELNTTVIVKDDLYVRATNYDGSYSSAPITTAAKVGDRLLVVELQYMAAKIGGHYVWAKVAIR